MKRILLPLIALFTTSLAMADITMDIKMEMQVLTGPVTKASIKSRLKGLKLRVDTDMLTQATRKTAAKKINSSLISLPEEDTEYSVNHREKTYTEYPLSTKKTEESKADSKEPIKATSIEMYSRKTGKKKRLANFNAEEIEIQLKYRNSSHDSDSIITTQVFFIFWQIDKNEKIAKLNLEQETYDRALAELQGKEYVNEKDRIGPMALNLTSYLPNLSPEERKNITDKFREKMKLVDGDVLGYEILSVVHDGKGSKIPVIRLMFEITRISTNKLSDKIFMPEKTYGKIDKVNFDQNDDVLPTDKATY